MRLALFVAAPLDWQAREEAEKVTKAVQAVVAEAKAMKESVEVNASRSPAAASAAAAAAAAGPGSPSAPGGAAAPSPAAAAAAQARKALLEEGVWACNRVCACPHDGIKSLPLRPHRPSRRMAPYPYVGGTVGRAVGYGLVGGVLLGPASSCVGVPIVWPRAVGCHLA
jgi:hypothetical protein